MQEDDARPFQDMLTLTHVPTDVRGLITQEQWETIHIAFLASKNRVLAKYAVPGEGAVQSLTDAASRTKRRSNSAFSKAGGRSASPEEMLSSFGKRRSVVPSISRSIFSPHFFHRGSFSPSPTGSTSPEERSRASSLAGSLSPGSRKSGRFSRSGSIDGWGVSLDHNSPTSLSIYRLQVPQDQQTMGRS